MSERVLLHVGTPKTGTSYLQEVLFRNRRTLLRSGILYPLERRDAHFRAALDLVEHPWGGIGTASAGAWDRLAAQVREHRGTSVVSHEILASASRDQADRALASLGHGTGAEVHLVLTVRDLVRQIPAEWQENLKHRGFLTYGEFVEQLVDPRRESRTADWFWRVQEIPDVLDRWGHDLPPGHVHLVTVPPPGSPQPQLWERFSRALGLDEIDVDLHAERSNPSLGVPETALLRRVNEAVDGRLDLADYRPLVRRLLAQRTLAHRTGSPRLALPPDVHPWASEVVASWVAEVERRGYDVVGDLRDLVGAPPEAPYADPDRPAEEQVAAAAVDAVEALLLEGARLRRTAEAWRRELDATGRPAYRWRSRVVRRLEAARSGRAALRAYRRVRGRSSRAA
ncbi:hypothetical protein [Nocardioides sp.]|uniref:hypothetical protein n=1 Tax=Nocardioides sp. TaxID=35761 RepID=UPI00378502C0